MVKGYIPIGSVITAYRGCKTLTMELFGGKYSCSISEVNGAGRT